MGKMTVCFCDLCGNDIGITNKQYDKLYSIPYCGDDEGDTPFIEPDSVNLCEECAIKIHDLCKSLDKTRG